MKKDYNSLSKDYVAGFLEINGGFFIHKVHDRKTNHPIFRMVVQRDTHREELVSEIFKWLLLNKGIVSSVYPSGPRSMSYQIQRQSHLRKFVIFIEENCYLKKKNHDDARELIFSVKRKLR